MTGKRKSTKKRDPNQIALPKGPDEEEGVTIARAVIRPTVQAAVTLSEYNKGTAALDLNGLITSLTEQTDAAIGGDLKRGEAMLAAQAHTLDAIFNNLARRAALNMGEYMGACDTYLRLALRAQAQSRATWEVLATMQNPPMANYVAQANVAHMQQVNNASVEPNNASRARGNPIPQNKLLEENHGERLDTRTTGTTGRADPAMETVGEVDGAEDTGGKRSGVPERI